MDSRLSPAPVLTEFATRLRALIDPAGCYVGGSLAFGDYRPGISDMDVVVVVPSRLDRRSGKAVVALHQELDVPALHCAYLAADNAADLKTTHAYWAQGELYDRAVSGIARAELLRGGIIVFGPPPGEVLPPLDEAEVRWAALAELSGYWTWAVGKEHVWTQDLYVDLGLITLARVEATVTGDLLITKAEAIARLGGFGVPESLIEEITRRRNGETVTLTDGERGERAVLARRLVSEGIARLLG